MPHLPGFSAEASAKVALRDGEGGRSACTLASCISPTSRPEFSISL